MNLLRSMLILAGCTLSCIIVIAAEAEVEPTAANIATTPGSRPSAGPSSAADRLDLDATVVTGNRELPKVLYIVPWKKAELGDLPEQPFNTLLDEALTPLDRDEFRREIAYHSKISTTKPATLPASP